MLFPLGTKGKVDRFPWVTVAIIATNIILYLPRRWIGTEAYFDTVIPIVRDTLSGRYLLSIFIHANFWHIFFNMIFFWTFGPILEDRMGRGRFFAFYMLGGVVATLVDDAFFAIVWHKQMVGIGASGALFAVIGAYILRFHFRKIAFLPFIPFVGFPLPLPHYLKIRLNSFIYIAFVMLTQIQAGVLQMKYRYFGTAYWAHLGGFAFGLAVALIFRYYRKGRLEKYMEIVEESRENGCTQTSEEAARKALEIDPRNLEAKHYLGTILSRFKPTAEGKRFYMEAIRHAFDTKNHDRAAEIYLEFLPKYKTTFPAWEQRLLAREMAARKKHSLAAFGLELWLEQHPGDPARPQMVLSLAHIYRKHMKAYDAARRLLLNFISENPDPQWNQSARDMLSGLPESSWTKTRPEIIEMPMAAGA